MELLEFKDRRIAHENIVSVKVGHILPFLAINLIDHIRNCVLIMFAQIVQI